MARSKEKTDILGVPGKSVPHTASAPTTRYSTSFEFNHSINSRKSLLTGIGVGSLSQFKEDGGALLRGHLSAGKGVGGVSLLKAGENAHYSLHSHIVRWVVRLIAKPGSGYRVRPHRIRAGSGY
jgi:hypothetical protein